MMKSISLDVPSSALKSSWIETPLGTMIAVADEAALYLLRFKDGRKVDAALEKLGRTFSTSILPGESPLFQIIESELKAYFEGTLKEFKTPLRLWGNSFQQEVWEELRRTPYGQTRSYLNQAIALSRPSSYRAVANANGVNQHVIIVPCHRIINKDGNLGGFGEGLPRKKWLLEHEAKYCL